MTIPDIDISEYFYELPESKIPNKPLAKRDESKLLVYKDNTISDHQFAEISSLLPAKSHLVFNNTKVFPARLIFTKDTGALIEIFCLQPLSQVTQQQSFNKMKWEVMVGNLKRWKLNSTLKYAHNELFATLVGQRADVCEVVFSWQGSQDFFEILDQNAELPLPPYMNRKADEEDKKRYQTVYAQHKGSVAAPTAGLHFTPEVLQQIEANHTKSELTLHVGSGTFKPVKAQKISDHQMHSEYFVVGKSLIEKLISEPQVIPVGTTSMRVLESLYWIGFQIINKEISLDNIHVNQWIGYQKTDIKPDVSLNAILNEMSILNVESIAGQTSIIIAPSYEFKICKGIITNFHQPSSTLILLVAALLGDDWRNVYNHALQNNYRFLSYGDSSLLMRK